MVNLASVLAPSYIAEARTLFSSRSWYPSCTTDASVEEKADTSAETKQGNEKSFDMAFLGSTILT